MNRILIVGANGQIARLVIPMLLENVDTKLTLFLRNSSRLLNLESNRVTVFEGDVTNINDLNSVMKNQDIVYVNLEGDLELFTKNVLDSMSENDVKKIILITSLGIYDEVVGKFGEWNRNEIGAYLGPYTRAANLVEASGFDYAIIRPAWLSNVDEIDYETMDRKEPFIGTEVSRKSVAALVSKLILSEKLGNQNLGINKPNTYWDKPSFY